MIETAKRRAYGALVVAIAALAASLAANVVTMFVAYRYVDVNRRQTEQVAATAVQNRKQITLLCRETNNLKRPIRSSLLRSKKALPKIAYYREHPGELATQLAEIELNLRAFHLRKCPSPARPVSRK